MRYTQARWEDNDGDVREPLLIEKDRTQVTYDASPLPDDLTRESLVLPDLSEPELARHYTRLSQMTYGIDTGPYPLGSCTMKYNPKFTELLVQVDDCLVHPNRPDQTVQGTLEIMHQLQDYLGRIGGMDSVTLQPPAGASGEFAGILIAKAYHEHRGETRSEIVVPDTAHGTNFASAALAGYDVVELPSGEDGRVNLDALETAVSDETAALMLTNPNTLGLFEQDIEKIADIVHNVDGLLYYDGANLNALLGRARPGDMGFDIMHYNVHKTFATPHGGGGPGAGPVGVKDNLSNFLPTPHIRMENGQYERYEPTHSVGKIHEFAGNWLVLLKAYSYIVRLGDNGLTDASTKAVLNANYLASQLNIDIPYSPFYHEFVASAGTKDAADVAKRMLDYGVHPPTTKWPEIVPEALMTEPTEIETKASLDQLALAFNTVCAESAETIKDAPSVTAVRKIDQASAARSPRLTWQMLE
ncbi:aminomethyl-transferring glycine dehydrogenase subunit GcvPB [Halocatena marina]|uniref:aminomethyl-transferring glycine dehydrogenase subunit GcvPB n=1 Tax=Halocatena marina TaxID=2934937 RepID=UPI00200FB0B6|nr:aminomethyl-transferring glycine dehydrogenase subunit GcvPB [Halocatena marina]